MRLRYFLDRIEVSKINSAWSVAALADEVDELGSIHAGGSLIGRVYRGSVTSLIIT